MKKAKNQNQQAVVERDQLSKLFAVLQKNGFLTLGPTLRDQAIVYDEITGIGDLPAGWVDRQDGGTYRLEKQGSALFGYVVGPQSWKKYFFPPTQELWSMDREGGKWLTTPTIPKPVKRALIGVRSCELHALAIQDKFFLEGPFRDPTYAAQRKNLFIVAVNCTRAGGTCFCTSMKTGPKATDGFDLALTEVIEGGKHYFVVETGSDAGEKILNEIQHQAAEPPQLEAADKLLGAAAQKMGRQLNNDSIKELLARNFDNSRWNEVAKRCLTCGNCTLVCPTCFCAAVEDSSDLTGNLAQRQRKWDSCFTMDHSYIHGGSIRFSVMARYRQWLSHKLGYWHDQYGVSGCVGCGRCITWCPVGIDITEEAQAIRQSDLKK